MSVNKEDTLRQFCDVTGADDARSRFFLESANWQLEVALSSFYEHGGNVDDIPSNPTPAMASVPVLSDSDMESPPTSPVRSQKKDKKKQGSSKFATLESLQQESSSDEDEETDTINPEMHTTYDCIKTRLSNLMSGNYFHLPTTSKLTEINYRQSIQSQTHGYRIDQEKEIEELKKKIEELTLQNVELKKEIQKLKRISNNTDKTGEAFYAGGSERSGQQILGPGKGKKHIVTEMFKSVREQGAVVLENEPTSTSRGRGAFSGVGYRLGQTADDHEQITPSNTQQQEQLRSVRLQLYREGFTVDSGPIRAYTVPENVEFLNCIRRGEIPAELSRIGGEVRISLEDRRHEECPHVAFKPQAFSGKGHLLGSPTPATVGATAPVAASIGDREANQRAAQEAVALDEASPVTTLQFRLADGSRLTGRFNHSHTVGDLHQYIARAEPTYQLQSFMLLTTFPSVELSDHTVTLGQANLLNTTLLQRLK